MLGVPYLAIREKVHLVRTLGRVRSQLPVLARAAKFVGMLFDSVCFGGSMSWAVIASFECAVQRGLLPGRPALLLSGWLFL